MAKITKDIWNREKDGNHRAATAVTTMTNGRK